MHYYKMLLIELAVIAVLGALLFALLLLVLLPVNTTTRIFAHK